MSKELDLFRSVVFQEADDDPPAEEAPAEEVPADEGPPDIDDSPPDVGSIEASPDSGDDSGGLDFGGDSGGGDSGEEGEYEEPEISDKISTILNNGLYQQFLTLLNTITNQISTAKGSSDIIFSVSPKALDALEPIVKLEENIKLYLSNNFIATNYSKNLLFYNKCLNSLKLLNQIFTKELNKGHSAED